MMKVKYLILLLFIALSSCDDKKDHTPSIGASPAAFDAVSSNGETLEVTIISEDPWTASTDATWCDLLPRKGDAGQKLAVIVGGNIDETARTATVTVTSVRNEQTTIRIHQDAAAASSGEFHYDLPVIFHVLYKDPSDPLQYVSKDRLAYILARVNPIYQAQANNADMNLTFSLAATDPAGNPMTSPGVEYIQWPEDYPIDCEKFMNDKTGKYVKYLWDPNKYINVMIYNFRSDDPTTTTLGISHMPFSTKGDHFLEGLNLTSAAYLSMENINHPHCASINSLCIGYESAGNQYDPRDIIVTLAHELGHYLGLHHVFSETDKGEVLDACEDTDYCGDTPSYNKIAYDKEYMRVLSGQSGMPQEQYFDYLIGRENCSGMHFTSHNVMDYAVSFCDQFTPAQRDRIRHVLTYSPLIPGPKKGQPQSRAAEGPLDLPLMIRK